MMAAFGVDWASLSAADLERMRVEYDTARMQDEACIAQLQQALQRHTVQLLGVRNEIMCREVCDVRKNVQEQILKQNPIFRLTRIMDLITFYLARRYANVRIQIPSFEKNRVRLTYQCFANEKPSGPEITIWIDTHGALKNPLTGAYINVLTDHPREWKL